MASSTIVSRKIIKPSSLTPPSLRCHNLSFMDYISVSKYMPMAFFYSKPQNYNITQISNILENSLSKVLSFYYSFAGQMKDNTTYVDCNDTGAEYLNVRVNCSMSEILNHPRNDVVEVVFPQDLPWSSTLNSSPLTVQLSHFDCGGKAVSICLSHKIADGYSMSKFFKDWASTARDEQLDSKPSPAFDGSSFFPLLNVPPSIPTKNIEPERNVSRMYHLSSFSLGRLKADITATSSGSAVQNLTRVEIATALVHKCGAIASMEQSGVFKPILLSHVMNLRPLIPLNTIGNATSFFSTVAMTEDDINIPNFVAQLQKAKQQLRDELKGMTTNQIATHAFLKYKQGPDLKVGNIFHSYYCTSICNFELYTIDFGWGRPVKMTLAKNPRKNFVVFMDDASGNGINVLITLTEADMLVFESNKELLRFASPVGWSSE
nr:ASAT3-L1 [Solanum aethiopicum]